MADGWRALKGDGTDAVPPLGTAYEAKLRDGRVWTELRITKFCLKFGKDLFRDHGQGNAPAAIRIVNEDTPHAQH